MDNNDLANQLSLNEPPSTPSAEGPVASRSRSALATVTDVLARAWQDVLIVGGLLTLFFIVHRRVEIVEFGGDAVIKWHFARQWWHHFDWRHADLDHHSGRMGVNVLAWLSQGLFGHGWRSYYVAPFFMAALQLPFVYGIGKRLANRLAGIWAALLVTYLETVHRSASQLLPDGFLGTYAIIAAYFYVRFAGDAGPRKKHFLVAMGLFGFFAYLAKETAVFFFPGMMLAVWMARRSVRDVATFLGVMFGGFLLETAFYATFTKYPSRYQVVRSVHGADGIWQQVTFGQLFDRFGRMHDGWKYLLFFTFASGLWLLFLNQHERARGRALAIIGFSQVFFLTFLVRRFNPIELWESFEPRYIEPFTPFAASMSGIFLGTVCDAGWKEIRRPAWLKQYGPTHERLVAVWAVAFLALFGLTQQALAKPPRAEDGFTAGVKLARLTNDAYRRNLPIAQARRGKTLQVMYNVYVDDKALLKDGQLPKIGEVVRSERGYGYFVKDPSRYPRGKFAQLRDAGCVLEVSRNRRGEYTLSTWEPLPSQCDELLRASLGSRREREAAPKDASADEAEPSE